MDASWPGPGHGGEQIPLAREAAEAVGNLFYRPPTVRALPPRAPRRHALTDPAGIGLTATIGVEAKGVARMVNYVNEDAPDPATSCGPAAQATLLTHWGVGAAARMPGGSCIATLADRYPPTRLGMSPRQITKALHTEGLRGGGWVTGEEQLRAALDRQLPAVVLLDLLPLGRGLLMHWVVAHAYDKDYVYITNWDGPDGPGRMNWTDFRKASGSVLTRAIHTADRYLVTWPE